MASMLEKKITLIKSTGASCLACDVEVKKGEDAVQVSFDVPLSFLGSATVTKEAHLECAEALVRVLKKRLSEAGWK